MPKFSARINRSFIVGPETDRGKYEVIQGVERWSIRDLDSRGPNGVLNLDFACFQVFPETGFFTVSDLRRLISTLDGVERGPLKLSHCLVH